MEYHGLTHSINYHTPNNRLNLSFSSSNIPDIVASASKVVVGRDVGPGYNSTAANDRSFEQKLRRCYTLMPFHSPNYYAHAMAPTHDSSMALATGPFSNIASLSLNRVDTLKIPEVYSAAKNALSSRYTPANWLQANKLKLNNSEKARQVSETLRKDCNRLGRFMDDRTRRGEEESSKRIGERISDISFMKAELANEHGKMLKEIADLTETKRCVEKALAETDNPLYVTQECLYSREKRQGIDLVHDACEMALLSVIMPIKIFTFPGNRYN
ncbi:hypothetical protein Ciccas_014218 [Cichlidogyrus casuarinus]|uniref:Tektin n=1 Tax=Cichlidogyrus casuarinus TaxID=1844966 RepID=A0ABD2PJR9_9PLAT